MSDFKRGEEGDVKPQILTQCLGLIPCSVSARSSTGRVIPAHSCEFQTSGSSFGKASIQQDWPLSLPKIWE